MPPRTNGYFSWLVSLTGELGKQYCSLLSIMHSLEFYELVPNDSNRAQDGLDLRYQYAKINHNQPNVPVNCTFLEMLIGLSHRMDYIARDPDDRSPNHGPTWFWQLITNLELMDDTDDILATDFTRQRTITMQLDRVVVRQYDWTGAGGLYPLENATEDQRNKEIWSQMNTWMEENVFDY